MTALALATLLSLQTHEIRVTITGAKFSIDRVAIPVGYKLRLVNQDAHQYTVECPGGFQGDVNLEPNSEILIPMLRGGEFSAMLEEQPDSELALRVETPPEENTLQVVPPFDLAKESGLQPLDYPEGREPVYGAITSFNLKLTGESGRQDALKKIYQLAGELSLNHPPEELVPYFSGNQWQALKGSISLVIGLGTPAFSRERFGPLIAKAKPAGLHNPHLPIVLKQNESQRDILVRVASDSAWFNARVCRLIWRRLEGKITDLTLESGYANPNGRSPILGGFYDGTGNPSGPTRTKAIYNSDGSSYLAFFRIRFDEEAFAEDSTAAQQAIIGRERLSGKPLRDPNPDAHKARANDTKSTIVRMPLIFDDGPHETGLLFISAQSSLTPLEKLLARMAPPPHEPGAKKDRLLQYMKFEEAAFYYIPASPKGSYPGSLTIGRPVRPAN